MTPHTTTWSEVQRRAAVPGSTVLARFKAEREASRVIQAAAGNGATQTYVSSDPRIVDLLGSGNLASSGLSVTSESAMRVSAVYACVSRIAGAISSMPVNLFRQNGGASEQIEGDPMWWLLNEEPTARFTSAAMWEQVVAQMLLKESGFVYIARNRVGVVQELIPLPYSAVQVRRSDDGSRLLYSIDDVKRWGADQDDMLHFPGFGFDGMKAMSVIQYAARNATGTAMAMDEYSGKFFAGGAHPSMVLSTDKPMSEKQREDLREAFAAKYSGLPNAHKLPLVLTEGIKADAISINADDAQLLDARKFQVVDIARAFGVPPHMIGETSAATSWGSGLEQLAIAFVRYTIQPHLVRMEQELNRKLYRRAGKVLKFDRASATAGDSKAEAEADKAGLGGPGAGPGWISVDEVRQRRKLPPLGGKWAKPYYPESKATTQPPKPADPAADPDPDTGDQP